MSVSKIVAAAASGSAQGAGLDVDECFSCHLYDGTGSAQTITNNIDLSGEGGLVWTKQRNTAKNHALMDTARGTNKYLISNTSDAENTGSTLVTSFNSNGYSIGTGGFANLSSGEYVSWTFRKAPNFFDCLTYTGDGSSSNTISHNLGSIPAFVVVKRTDSTGDWHVAARQSNGSYIHGNASFPTALNLTSAGNAVTSTSGASDMSLTSTTFDAKKINGFNTHNGSGNLTNINGATYVAYLFAHNNNDGGFGAAGDQDIIKCGSYTGDGADDGPTIDLGFEPQFILSKRSDSGSQWNIVDTMRGLVTGGSDVRLYPNLTNADDGFDFIEVTPTGFKITTSATSYNASGGTYIYMAIRRGPLAAPEDATKVFNVATYSSNGNSNIFNTGFDVDMNITTRTGGTNNYNLARLTGSKYLWTDGTNAEADLGDTPLWDGASNSLDLSTSFWGTTSDTVSWSFKRAPGFFDVVAWDGNNTAGRTISHNLGVVPEMIWIKNRQYSVGEDWAVYHKGLNGGTDPEDYYLRLNANSSESNNAGNFNDTAPTSTVFTVGADRRVNGNVADGNRYIAYLFATVAGVSKVGSYTGNGGTQNIDCGFSSGARFVLIKRSSNAQDWYIFDSTRGIVAGNDPYLKLNTTDSEATAADEIDPLSSGFTIHQTGSAGINFSGHTYIFYAIA